MGTLVISYDDLNDASHQAKNLAEKLGDYANELEHKVCRKINEYSGERTQNLYDADGFMRKKLEKLQQKKIDFTTLSSNIKIFESNCKTADNNVARSIKTITGDFKKVYKIKENVITNFFNYIGVAIGNATAIGRAIKDCIGGIQDVIKSAGEAISDWYKYDGGKYLIEGAIEGIGAALLGAVTAIAAVAAFAAASTVGAVIVGVAAVVVAVATVANGISAVYNDSKAYQVAKNGDAATAVRYAGRDTLADTLRHESDSKLVHILAGGLEIVELAASVVLIVDAGINIAKGAKNLVRKVLNKGGSSVVEGAKYSYITEDTAKALKTEKDTAFFWSGCSEFDADGNVITSGDIIASEIAKSEGGVTLESTIADQSIDMPKWDFDNPDSIKAWEEASSAYASQVSGDIRAVVGTNLRANNIWESIELPKLMQNENVSKITTINSETMEQTVIFERDVSGNITTIINDTLYKSGQWDEILENLSKDSEVNSITVIDSSGRSSIYYERK
ncbi:hypothetical protein [Anaeromicropila herbilytica]|uniref:Uncharacterized protein n=1 Tax=Anaeromicropila herbilytica TaxID=2785025 RepID=A0A7R7IER1_9FIRM|nr:hypothetical protein [Anaeromicropila herbilytica]BCN32374.1 hypothetical protein bsdtb5_36690 [Anaeromicropila herbilytica]